MGRTAVLAVATFLIVVATIWWAHDLGYSQGRDSHRISDYNEGFVEGENTNVSH